MRFKYSYIFSFFLFRGIKRYRNARWLVIHGTVLEYIIIYNSLIFLGFVKVCLKFWKMLLEVISQIPVTSIRVTIGTARGSEIGRPWQVKIRGLIQPRVAESSAKWSTG